MKRSFYFLVTLGNLIGLVATLPQLCSRDDNSADWQDIAESATDDNEKVEDISDSFQIPESESPELVSQSKSAVCPTNSGAHTSDTYNIRLEKNPQGLQVPKKDCDPMSSTSSHSSCQHATRQIIYPRKCAQNHALTAALNAVIKPKVVKSLIDNSCGVSFYSASLTSIEISKIKRIEGVKTVAMNMKMDRPRKLRNSKSHIPKTRKGKSLKDDLGMNEDNIQASGDILQASEDDLKDDPQTNEKSNGINSMNEFSQLDDQDVPDLNVISKTKYRRSEADFVTERPNEAGNLAFISTPKSRGMKKLYHSFRKSGHGTRLYLVCAGVDSTHRSFFRAPFNPVPEHQASNERSEIVIKQQINTADASPFGVVDENYVDGTCAASIAIGEPFGVALYPDLVVVKVALTVQSFLEGWLEVLNNLGASSALRGHTVVETHHSWYRGPDMPKDEQRDLIAHEEQLKNYISRLIKQWQVVVVVPATSSSPTSIAIDTFPGILSTEDEFPIIVVGAVNLDGSAKTLSPEGPALTVSAPGTAECAGLHGDDVLLNGGTTLAAPHVAGLALYFLSLAGLGDRIRQTGSVARTMRNFILYKAYTRQNGFPYAIWNGLNPYAPDSEWDYLKFFDTGRKS